MEAIGWTGWLSIASIAVGAVFFGAGTMGMLRFPDVYTRLHALTKADNLGFGFVVLGCVFVAPGVAEIVKLAVIWLLILVAGTTAAHVVANAALHEGGNVDDSADDETRGDRSCS